MNDAKKSMRADRRAVGAGFTWLAEIIITISCVLALAVVIAANSSTSSKDEAREAEVKSNLHTIQLAVERYAVDHDGQRPAYLIGGQGKYSQFVEGVESDSISFINPQTCPKRSTLSDPLLREGYIEAYPKNPFAGNGASIHLFQIDKGDPLYNGSNVGVSEGTRFGPYCNLMGNVMADYRRSTFAIIDSKGVRYEYPTYCNILYPCSDMWKTDKPTPFLPGEFFYRSRSVKVIENGMEREEIQDYMLGAYGAIRTKGKDVIGPDPTGENLVTPFGIGPKDYGNPNGIRDGVILVLTPGWDEPGQTKAGGNK